MPKIKTYKGAAKRFKLTGSGKLVRTKGGKSHLRRRRAKRAKKMYSRTLVVDTPAEVKRVKRLIPYASKGK